MLKQIVRTAAQRSGALQWVQRWNRDRVRILMYHHFPPEFRGNFDAQCAFLSTHYQVISLAEATRRLENGDPVSDAAVITVDDGYSDMYEVAFPILRKYNLPATLFVTTGFINGTCWMAGDRVRHYFAHTRRAQIEVTDHQGTVHTYPTGGRHASEGLRELLKRVPNGTRARILAELEADEAAEEAAALPAEYQPCTWEHLREMAAGGVTIGAHTVTHPILSRVESADETEREILESKACIEREFGRKIDLFAYPNGTEADFNGVSLSCVRSHFRGAVTAIAGLNAPGVDVHQLLRLPCGPELPIDQFARMLAGPLRRRDAIVH